MLIKGYFHNFILTVSTPQEYSDTNRRAGLWAYRKEMVVLPTKQGDRPAFTEQILSDEIVFFIFSFACLLWQVLKVS